MASRNCSLVTEYKVSYSQRSMALHIQPKSEIVNDRVVHKNKRGLSEII